ncbi:MAG: anti-sigma factor antagonist [Candidatus Eisenbacteria bacterium]|nr:anti-sigma factor antagonist [Candidatus Eisenbacteria bacterium]
MLGGIVRGRACPPTNRPEENGMDYRTRKVGDVVVFDLKGALEGGEKSYRIKDVVKEQLAAGQRKFLLNLDKVTFVNSTGVGIVAMVFTSISNAGGEMKICNANEKVSRVMMITKLLEVFDSYYQEDEALAAFAGD